MIKSNARTSTMRGSNCCDDFILRGSYCCDEYISAVCFATNHGLVFQVISSLDLVEDELNQYNQPPSISNTDMTKLFGACEVQVPATYIDILHDLKEDDNFTLGECLLIASMLKEKQNNDAYYHLKSPRPVNKKLERKSVFLGGSCNPTTWRGDIVIPMFQAKRIDFYNPQVDEWTEALVQAEAKAKEQANLLFFVLDNETRSLASIMETCYFLGTGKPLTLIVKEIDCSNANKWHIQVHIVCLLFLYIVYCIACETQVFNKVTTDH